MAAAEFWYEFASTYSYPAAMRVADLAQSRGVALAWQPFLLGPIFAAQGWRDSPFNIYPAKGRYMWRDMKRICDALGLPPLKRPVGDGVNIAARLEGIAKPGAICLSEDAYRQVSGRLDMEVSDLGPTQLKNIEMVDPGLFARVCKPAQAKPTPSMTWGDPAKALSSKRRLGSGPLALAIAALVLLAAAGAWYVLGGRERKPTA